MWHEEVEQRKPTAEERRLPRPDRMDVQSIKKKDLKAQSSFEALAVVEDVRWLLTVYCDA